MNELSPNSGKSYLDCFHSMGCFVFFHKCSDFLSNFQKHTASHIIITKVYQLINQTIIITEPCHNSMDGFQLAATYEMGQQKITLINLKSNHITNKPYDRKIW